jgi:Na+/phosphate symporter
MVAGSRLGASFVVLVIGVLDDLRAGRREKRSAYIGVTALLTTAIIYLPGTALAHAALVRGMLLGLQIDGRDLVGVLDAIFGPLLAATAGLPRAILFLGGVGVLLAAFKAFDRALPDLKAHDQPLARPGHVVYRPWFMFALGLGTTALTLSVSVSLSLLVPLAAKGYVRRENVWPYVVGANITTLVDTLLAGALVGHPDGVRIIALLMGVVTLLSLPAVFVFPYAFGHFVDRLARRATASGRTVLAFVAALFLVPLALLAL